MREDIERGPGCTGFVVAFVIMFPCWSVFALFLYLLLRY